MRSSGSELFPKPSPGTSPIRLARIIVRAAIDMRLLPPSLFIETISGRAYIDRAGTLLLNSMAFCITQSNTTNSLLHHIDRHTVSLGPLFCIIMAFVPIDPPRCARYARFASHLERQQFDVLYWTLFIFNLFVLFIAAFGYTKYVSLKLLLCRYLVWD